MFMLALPMMLIMSKAMMDKTEDFTDFDVIAADDVDFVEHIYGYECNAALTRP